ncbi:hypothetical protein SAMN06296241_2104 [Salinimicrobium sediminis]|uniref:Uncharacterized protein n=1 Tax=Salinimicrobium sediminis TaxID=1343891 RepID=A0A285X5F6_9FLAO|nr:hypothetical protein [Salinimicrobium sediminis]SOC80552.1 hypothetical protein SAMN06296241_2104 [Salinimicrobium sediminis]
MLVERVNLQRKLEALRNKEMEEEKLLEEVQRILEEEKTFEADIIKRISEGDPEGIDHNNFIFDLLESGRIFHLSQIKKICITYRLRFLNTSYFKGDLPQEAISAVKQIERAHSTTLQNFKIIAPAEFFRLENADDPMLFAPIGNDYFYLIHKWGKDMHPLRKMMKWPLKNLENLIIFSFFASFLLSFGIREIFFSSFQKTSEFLVIFMYTFKSVIGLVFFYGIALGKNFSSGNWNSKFYNA